MNSTVDKKEVNHFNKPHQDWWDESGSFSTLHKLTPCRVEYISQVIRRNIINKQMYSSPKVCSDLSILDIGCGGGLLCEPLSKLGAQVVGIDASEKNIKIAKIHAKKNNLRINYYCASPENFISKEKFDVVLNMEIIEHVQNVNLFLKEIGLAVEVLIPEKITKARKYEGELICEVGIGIYDEFNKYKGLDLVEEDAIALGVDLKRLKESEARGKKWVHT